MAVRSHPGQLSLLCFFVWKELLPTVFSCRYVGMHIKSVRIMPLRSTSCWSRQIAPFILSNRREAYGDSLCRCPAYFQISACQLAVLCQPFTCSSILRVHTHSVRAAEFFRHIELALACYAASLESAVSMTADEYNALRCSLLSEYSFSWVVLTNYPIKRGGELSPSRR